MATQKRKATEELHLGIKTRCARLLEEGKFTDCRFLVGREDNQAIICGHKLLLSIASPVFETMFSGSLPVPDNMEAIEIPDVETNSFRGMLKYVYSDVIEITSFDQACGLYYAAKKYMLPGAVKLCADYLQANVCAKNACRTYEFGKLFDEPELMEKSLRIITTKTKEVFDDSSFMDVELSTLCVIFDQTELNVESEVVLFNALEKLVIGREFFGKNSEEDPCLQFDPTNKDHMAIRGALKKVRFLNMSALNFVTSPGRSRLLSDTEKLFILCNRTCGAIANFPLPDGFSACRDYRNSAKQLKREIEIEKAQKGMYSQYLDKFGKQEFAHDDNEINLFQRIVLNTP